MPKTPLVAFAVIATAGSLLAGSASAAPAAHKPHVTVIAKKLVGPLSVAQAPDGTRYWTDNFAGPLYRQAPGGQPTVVFAGSATAAAEGVSADGGQLRFATGSKHGNKSHIWTLDPSGAVVQIADIGAYEQSANPDGKTRYGFLHTPKSCLAQLPKQVPGSYKGIVETHPYGTAWANGVTYVADAAGNDVLAVSPTGTVSTVAVLPPAKVKITRDGAKANHLPACTVGHVYAFEPVPTDVEVGPDGSLYVTSLPGGPEDASLGANGRLFRIRPGSSKARLVTGGLISPTGVAVASNGDLYVSQLFIGEISKIKAGSSKVRPYVRVPLPAAVEWTPSGLLATINALPGKKPKGEVVSITP